MKNKEGESINLQSDDTKRKLTIRFHVTAVVDQVIEIDTEETDEQILAGLADDDGLFSTSLLDGEPIYRINDEVGTVLESNFDCDFYNFSLVKENKNEE